MALVQSIAPRSRSSERYIRRRSSVPPEVLDENRFLAARDGVDAELIDVERETRVPFAEQLGRLLEACVPHARALGCGEELERV